MLATSLGFIHRNIPTVQRASFLCVGFFLHHRIDGQTPDRRFTLSAQDVASIVIKKVMFHYLSRLGLLRQKYLSVSRKYNFNYETGIDCAQVIFETIRLIH